VTQAKIVANFVHMVRHGTERFFAEEDRQPAVDIAVARALVVRKKIRHTKHEQRVGQSTRITSSQLYLYCTDGCMDCVMGWFCKI
jgi:hypothetical protein